MPHDFHLVRREIEPGHIHERFDRGELRASIDFLYGPYKAMGITYLSAEAPADAAAVPSDNPGPLYCLLHPGNCVNGLVDEIGRVVSSQHPAEWVVFAFCQVPPGARTEFETHLLERMEDRSDSRVAAAHALGPESIDVIVEVVGDALPDVARRVRELTDTPLVARAEICVTTGRNTRGFGSEDSKRP